MSYNVNHQHNERATIFLKNLSDQVDEDILFELGTQFGEVNRVNMPLNKDTGKKEDFGFIEFKSPADAQYMSDVIKNSAVPLRLFGKQVTVTYKGDQRQPGGGAATRGGVGGSAVRGGVAAPQQQHQDAAASAAADALLDIGAKLVVYNLDLRKCEMLELLDKIRKYFGQFGRLAVPPSIQQSTNTATVSFTTFEASDAAKAATDNQFLFGQSRKVRVDYAMREDGRGQHGSVEERALYSGTPSERQAAAARMLALQQQQQYATSNNNNSNRDQDDDVPDWAQGLNPYSAI